MVDDGGGEGLGRGRPSQDWVPARGLQAHCLTVRLGAPAQTINMVTRVPSEGPCELAQPGSCPEAATGATLTPL